MLYKLKPAQIKSAKPGKIADGGGLYLFTRGDGRQSWTFRFVLGGKRQEIGLGGLKDTTLAKAREKAKTARDSVALGYSPRSARIGGERDFETIAKRYIALQAPGWRNAKHHTQWSNTLSTYAYPSIGERDVDDINVNDIIHLLQPIWSSKHETASRVRSRIENVLSYATVTGLRKGPNPAVWRGNLDMVLPGRNRVGKVTHHQAIDWRELPALYQELIESTTMSALGLRWLILTASRYSETTGATFSEISKGTWTIPGTRMKVGKQHQVPLSDHAIALVEKIPRDHALLFPSMGWKKRLVQPMSENTMTHFLQKRRPGCTVHGMRSAFKDWSLENTDYPEFVSEMALAHDTGSAVRRAYARTKLVEMRRGLMQDWGDFLCTSGESAQPV
jgi:integrase